MAPSDRVGASGIFQLEGALVSIQLPVCIRELCVVICVMLYHWIKGVMYCFRFGVVLDLLFKERFLHF